MQAYVEFAFADCEDPVISRAKQLWNIIVILHLIVFFLQM